MKNSVAAVEVEKSGMAEWMKVVLLLVSGLFIWFAIVSNWITGTIFDQEVFVSQTVAALTTPQSREAISQTLVDRVLSDFPIIRQAVGPTLTNTVSGVLDSPQFQPVFQKAATQVFIQLTTPNPQEVSVEVKSATNFAGPILEKLDSKLAAKIANLPDKVVIIKKGQIPSLYKFGSKISFFGPILGVVGLALFGYLVWKSKGTAGKLKLVSEAGIIFAGYAFILYQLIPTAQVWMLAKLNSDAAVTIVTQLFGSLTASLVQITQTSIIAGVVVAIGAFVALKLTSKRSS